ASRSSAGSAGVRRWRACRRLPSPSSRRAAAHAAHDGHNAYDAYDAHDAHDAHEIAIRAVNRDLVDGASTASPTRSRSRPRIVISWAVPGRGGPGCPYAARMGPAV